MRSVGGPFARLDLVNIHGLRHMCQHPVVERRGIEPPERDVKPHLWTIHPPHLRVLTRASHFMQAGQFFSICLHFGYPEHPRNGPYLLFLWTIGFSHFGQSRSLTAVAPGPFDSCIGSR